MVGGMKRNQRKEMVLKQKLTAPATKGDLEEMGVYIVGAVAKTLEEYTTKEDLKAVEKQLGDKIDGFGGDVSDLRHRVRDLEADTITRREFNDFKTKVLPQ